MSPPVEKPFPMGEREFVGMMAALMALQALAIDIMLPGLGIIARDLHVTDPNDRQLIIGIFLICAGLGSLIPGAMADRFGRRRVLLICLTGYGVLNLLAALASEFTYLLILRGCTGLFSAGLLVISSTVIRDRYSGDAMARKQSLVAMVFMVVPMAAPSLGQAVLAVASWRWIFAVTALLGCSVGLWAWFRLPETLHPEFRQPIRVGAIVGNMKVALTNRQAVGYIFGIALVTASMFGYLNSSQQLVAEHFGAGDLFPLIFGGMALAMSLANLGNSRIVMRFGARRVSHAGLLIYIACAGLQLWLALRGNETIWEFVGVMTLNMCMMGFIGANFGAIALQPFSRIAGAAASVQAFVRLSLGSLLGALIGHSFDGSARPLAMAMFASSLAALLAVLYSERGRLFQRLHGSVEQA